MSTLSGYHSLPKTLNGIVNVNANLAQIGDITISGDTISGVDTIYFEDGVHTASIGLDTNGDLLVDGTGELRITSQGGVNMEGETLNMNQGEIHNVPLIHGYNNTDMVIEGKGTGDLILKTNNVNRVVVDDNGNINMDSGVLYVDAVNNRVGINHTNPSQAFSLIGNQLIAPNTSNLVGTPFIQLRNTGLTDGSPNSLIMGVDGSKFNGVAYINTTKGGVAGDTPLTFRINGTERMRINGSGQLGIGTNAPSQLLDVNGISRFRNTVNLDGNLSVAGSSTMGNIFSSGVGTFQGINAITLQASSATFGTMNTTTFSASFGSFLGLNSTTLAVSGSSTMGNIFSSGIGTFQGLNSITLAVSGSSTMGNIFSSGIGTYSGLNAITLGATTATFSGDIAVGGRQIVSGSLSSDTQTTAGIYQGLVGTGQYRVKLVNSSTTASDAPSIDFSTTSTDFQGRIEYRHDQAALRFYTGGTQRMMLDAYGQLSVGGTSNPASNLDLQTGDFRIRNGRILLNNTFSSIGINTSDALIKLNPTSSNVGIGVAPSHKLDVSGNINISSGSTYKINGVDVLSSSNIRMNPVSVGVDAGLTSQGINSIAIGRSAGNLTQGVDSIAIGTEAGFQAQGNNSIAIGDSAGYITQGNSAIAIGIEAGYTSQGNYSIAIGSQAGSVNQGTDCVAIGRQAGSFTQGTGSVAIGSYSGQSNQKENAIAIGYDAGKVQQSSQSVAIGYLAGQNTQGAYSIAIGNLSGCVNQSRNGVAIGNFSGFQNQGTSCIAIGSESGSFNQASSAVAIGNLAGNQVQKRWGIAIGESAGQSNQGQLSVAIGRQAGQTNQGEEAFAIGYLAGSINQGSQACAIGTGAGQTNQAWRATAIGYLAGWVNQGSHSLALGHMAGRNNQHERTIVLNASTTELQTNGTDRFFVRPIRQSDGISTGVLSYNTTTREITHSQTLNFDSGVLVVDMLNNRVGINTASPSQTLDVRGNLQVYNSSLLETPLFVDQANLSVGILTTSPAHPLHIVSPVNDILCLDGTSTGRCNIKWKASAGETEYEVGIRGTAGNPDNSFYIYQNKKDNTAVNQYRMVITEDGTMGIGGASPNSNFRLDTLTGYIRTRQICCRITRDMAATSIAPNNSMFNASATIQFDLFPSGLGSYGFQASGTYIGMYRYPIGGYYQITVLYRFSDGGGGQKGMVPKNFDGTSYYNIINQDDNTMWCPEDGSGRRCGCWSSLVSGTQGWGFLPTTYNAQNMDWAEMSISLVYADQA